MEKVSIKRVNEVYVKIECEASTAYELSDHFTFEVPGAKFSPAYRNRQWDGKIRLYNIMTRQLYAGLVDNVIEFCRSREYDVELPIDYGADEFSVIEAKNFIHGLNLKLEPRDYQIEAFVHAIRSRRSLLLSPTASGKSYIIYLITRYINKKTLIIVPTTTLVHQMASDFTEYGYGEEVYKIVGGVSKDVDQSVTVSTWQSIYKMPKQWFKQFDVVIGYEAHLFKAKSLISIMENLPDCKFWFGFTGTLDGSATNKLVLEGLFGQVRKVISTSELIEQKHLSQFKIKCIVLKYSEETCKQLKGSTYQDEMDFLVRNKTRNRFIKNLTLSLEGNTLLLFQYVDKHGRELYDSIKDNGIPTYFIHGGVEGQERDQVRKIVEGKDKAIIIASYGTFSTGINIKRLHNIVFASPSKSKIRNLQSIGRALRKSEMKEHATLFDISDDLSYKSKRNHTIGHFIERCKIYDEERFSYTIYTTKLKL